MSVSIFIKNVFVSMLFLLLCNIVFAQKQTITGFVKDSTTGAAIQNVIVTDLASNKKTITDDSGKFFLPVAISDMLFFTAEGYHFQTLKYSAIMEQTIFITMSTLPHVLPGVTVTTTGYTKYQHDSINRLNEFNADLVSKPYSPATKAHSQGFGIGISLDFLSSREKSKRKAEKLFNEHEKDAYTDYRFSPEFVSAYTGLQGDSLSNFIQLYGPDYDWLRRHLTDEDVMYYINDKLKLFYARKK